ncbi:SpaA isopeptide-forming pilin-related protein [Blautia caccae]|uniref:SpaA isopeptide-forming pilin-related protein n=1 Tax=Blautia caccae TaxID=3133175 RepID=A0ABV1DRY2_9FIRM
MKKRTTFKRMLSGIMAAMTLFTTVLSPISAAAAEPEPKEKEPPAYEQVKEQLSADEVVTAKDYELLAGTAFDVETDLTGLEIVDETKVKVKLYEAKNESGEDFSTSHADTYKAVYYVEPLSGHPVYQIQRNLIVKEPESQTVSENTAGTQESAGQTPTVEESEEEEPEPERVDVPDVTEEPELQEETEQTEKTGTGLEETPETNIPETMVPETEIRSEDELNAALEKAKEQDTVDEETGLTLGEVWNQMIEGDVDIFSMEEGETITFTAYSQKKARSTDVEVTNGEWYYYADYGLGTYVTQPFTVKFGSVTATAYCIEPSKPGPGSGVYEITKLGGGKELAKVCYYGTGASGSYNFYEKKHPDFSEGKRFIVTHLAASYANGSSDAFYGANDTGIALAKELYDYAVGQENIPDVDMKFSDADVTAYVDGNRQRTKEITFKADVHQTIIMKLPDGVKFHNVTTGKTSAAGADVKVSGGTVFYLSAPLTQTADVSGSWSAKMQGSITKDYSAYKITTGGDTQSLALVFGEGVEDKKYVNFSVKWIEQAMVEIVKQDADTKENLSGAVYGIYSDAACKKLITQMPATDKDGKSKVTILKTQDTVYLKEITAPTGYCYNATASNVTLVANKTSTVHVTDKEQLGNLTVYKVGEVFTGAVSNAEGTTFQYESRKQKGAVYNVYAKEDIKTPTGKIVYKAGELVKEHLVTGDNGEAVLKDLHFGTYQITEVQAPQNFVNQRESKMVTLTYAGQTAEAVFAETTFQNERQKTEVHVVKLDKDTENPLSGAVFGLYAGEDMKNADGTVVVKKDTLLGKAESNGEGEADFYADIPIGYGYYVKELQAPENYLRNSEEVYSFRFTYTNDEEPKVTFTHTFANERVSATIKLQKTDLETNTNKPQGDASLEHAVYGLYARKDIVHPDKKSGTLYKAGEQVGTLTTDAEGKASIENLYLGEYFVKEITPPVGYLADEREYDLICNYEGDLTAVVERSCTSPEQVKKQPFQIIKAANNGNTDAELLAGAGFTAYLKSSLKVKEDGTYDFASAEPVVIGENGATEIFTDEKGYAVSIPLPYGTYVVRETTTPHNYKPVDDFIVRITEHKPTEPQVWRVLLDAEFSAKLKIIKQDDETKKPVLAADTEFKVYDLDHKKYVEQVTTYPTTVTHKSYFTDADGYLILPQNLKIGHYRIEEVTAPDGYVINKNYVEVKVDTDTLYQIDPVSGDAIIEVVYENHPVKGELVVVKKGDVLDGYGKDFIYEEQNLAGAVFAVYAAEDIYTADFQKDGNGNRILEYAKDTLVAELTTNESGKAVLKDLPLGAYQVVEKTAPEGFVLNPEEQKVTFAYVDQDTPVVVEAVEWINARQKVEIAVIKQDAENEQVLAGAELGLYAKEDIKAGEKVLVEADTLLSKAVTGKDGKAVFEADVPFGRYYIKELQAPAGFVSSDAVIEVTASYQGQEVEVVRLTEAFKNQPTTTKFTKTDLTTGVELSGATLTVLDKKGNQIDTWTSVKGKSHIIKRLQAGETYILRETFAPYGYLKAEEVEFTISDTEKVQKVEMKDEVPVGRILISKKGEFLNEVTWNDMVAGAMESVWDYLNGSLKDVTFEVYAAEDIKAADGESADHFKKDELVETITTDALGFARADDLPLGKYYVKEKETADGFILDDQAREIDLTYRDQDTPVVTYDSEWQNNRQKAKVTVLKKEKDSDRVLEGGVFALCVKEDIKNADGKVLVKADTVVEQKATDAEGKILFTADLPVGGSFYVKEVQAPAGFVTTEERKEFTFDYAGAETPEVVFEFLYENEATTFEITKSDLTTGEELPGAKLQMTDPDGNVVDSWVSGKEPHIIKELEVGKEYVLTEILPAEGYVTAESITFTVENTADVQKVEMKDDVTKVEISKVDMTDGSTEMEGAKLYILNENNEVMESWTSGKKPHYVEKLPVGKYTLLEESAPKGYIVSQKVPFEVKDTGEIQSVKMEDAQAMGKVILNKTDKDTQKPLKGVEFTLYDRKGKALETLVTDSAGHAESKEYPIAIFKDGTYEKALVYILKETKTLEGYQLDETEHEITFGYADDRTPVVEYQMELTNEKLPEEKAQNPGTPGQPSTSVHAPKTGDETNIWLFVAVMAASAGGVGFLTWKKKRK